MEYLTDDEIAAISRCRWRDADDYGEVCCVRMYTGLSIATRRRLIFGL